VLTGTRAGGNLPTIRLADPPATGRVGNRSAAALVEVAGAAPLAILRRLDRITRVSGKGIVATMSKGPSIYFGDTSRLEAKWADAVAILADRGSQGASYVDVRMPDRPVAGGLHLPPDPTTASPAGAVPTPTTASPTGAAPPTGGTP
jgi:cell division protein FtsQ